MYCSNKISYVIKSGDNLYHLSRYYKTTVPAILSLNPDIDPYNLQIGRTITICPGDDFIVSPESSNPPSCPNPCMQISLINSMRLAWLQHVYWTRMLLISIAQRLKDQSDVTNRLLQNPKDILNIFAKYYSADVAKTIESLLTEHLQIGAMLITALRDGDTMKADNLSNQWYRNADKMAEAFSSISPYYDKETLRDMLYKHLQLTTKEVEERLKGNYLRDIKAFGDVEQEVLSMSDYFTSGIMSQFPQKFS